jgi:hypothetical protein
MTDQITQLDVTVAEHGRDLLSLGRRVSVAESENRECEVKCDRRLERCDKRMRDTEDEVTQLKVQAKILMGTIGVTAFGYIVQTLVNWFTSGAKP